MNPLTRIDISLIEPDFRLRVELALQELSRSGVVFVATCGYRSPTDQDALYASGRTISGPIITHARAWESAHQFGLAIDVVRDIDDKPGVQPSWQASDYLPLAMATQKFGLVWGGLWRFPDAPHIQDERVLTSYQMAALKSAWRMSSAMTSQDKLRMVWANHRESKK
jgi:peptidoglycan L-alanyl-D-glutamate endopeptidase CwlK